MRASVLSDEECSETRFDFAACSAGLSAVGSDSRLLGRFFIVPIAFVMGLRYDLRGLEFQSPLVQCACPRAPWFGGNALDFLLRIGQQEAVTMSTTGIPTPTVALFLDCENVGLAGYDAQLVLQWVATQGRVLVRRAYADWAKNQRLHSELHAAAIELIDMPADVRGKNRADIRLVVDAMEVALTRPNIDTFVIASGDSDFVPLLNRIREYGRYTIVVARRDNRSGFLKPACDQLIYLDQIAASLPTFESRLEDVHRQLRTAFDGLVANKEAITFLKLKRALLINDDDFCHTRYGFKTFKDFVLAFDPSITVGAEAIAQPTPIRPDDVTPKTEQTLAQKTPVAALVAALDAKKPKPGSQQPVLSKTTKNASLPVALLDRVYWAVRLLREAGCGTSEASKIQNELVVLFPKFRLQDYGIAKSAGYRKLFTAMELEGLCALEFTVAGKSKVWKIEFLDPFLHHKPRLPKPATFEPRLKTKLAMRNRPFGPTVPNPYPLPSFARQKPTSGQPASTPKAEPVNAPVPYEFVPYEPVLHDLLVQEFVAQDDIEDSVGSRDLLPFPTGKQARPRSQPLFRDWDLDDIPF